MEVKTFDIESIRKDFPVLDQEVNGYPLVYLDNAATSQKPKVVVDALSDYYLKINSNIHRGVHHLSQVATDAFEQTREKVRSFINAEHAHEIIFTSGTTEGINLVAHVLGKKTIEPWHEILISKMEHHSNIVPWQLLAEYTGAKLVTIPITDEGELDMDEFHALLNENTAIVAVNHISNSLGTINPVKEIISAAHEVNAWVLIDGAQSAPHMRIDVRELDADFYVFSAHKMCGPTGVGVLYGKEAILNELPPYKGGGEMISEVSMEKSTYAGLPHKFEAGTPNIGEVVAFKSALDYMDEIGLENIAAYEHELLDYAMEKLSTIEGIVFHGTAAQKTSVISFNLKGIHPYDVGMILDKLGVAVRTGHHCTQPVMKRYNIPGTVRASMAFYNTKEEIDRLYNAVLKAQQMLS
jgi:cysteine desulfurase/selenocysteine lyase